MITYLLVNFNWYPHHRCRLSLRTGNLRAKSAPTSWLLVKSNWHRHLRFQFDSKSHHHWKLRYQKPHRSYDCPLSLTANSIFGSDSAPASKLIVESNRYQYQNFKYLSVTNKVHNYSAFKLCCQWESCFLLLCWQISCFKHLSTKSPSVWDF